jgi:ABC-type branched-subunit amino acid transport system ATPase component/ABC-type branched-subunit amino acid transport system permease subunit
MSPARAFAVAVGRLRAAARGGLEDARRASSRRAGAWVFAYATAALLVPFALSPTRLTDLAVGLYVALAAVGLNYAVGLAGLPSLGQGAFAAAGAFTVALLMSRLGWAPAPAVLAGVGIAAAGGFVAGAGAVRLAPPFVAVSTWLVAWLASFALAAFPNLFGGAQGIPVGRPAGPGGIVPGGDLTPAGHFEIALALLALALLGYAALRRGPAGIALSAAGQAPAAAAALGLEPAGRRLGAFVASAAIGGLAGGLAVQAEGIADPGAYGPLLSVELFVAVLLGGRGSVIGPVVGAAVLAGIPSVARALAAATGTAAERVEGVVAAALLVVALVAGGTGAAGVVERLRRRHAPGTELHGRIPKGPARKRGPRKARRPALAASGLTIRFGGVLALDDVSFEVRPGQVHALIGPNGSGKTTLLRILAGTIRPDGGSIELLGRDVTGTRVGERVRRGLVRTLQRTAVFPDLTVAQHVQAGADARRSTGALRTLLATPDARAETRAIAREGWMLLALAGLRGSARARVGSLPGAEQRLVAIVTALTARPRVVLLDEPAAGMSQDRREDLVALLDRLRGLGLAIVLVEHDLRLVRAVADVVTVLDAGTVIARGTPRAVADRKAVQRAYLGDPRA